MKIRLYEIIKKGLLLIIMVVSANMGAQKVLETKTPRMDIGYLDQGIYAITALINDSEHLTLKVVKN